MRRDRTLSRAGRTTRAGLAVAGLIVATLGLAGCEGNILDPVGPVGAAERTILLDASVIMAAIIGPIILATPVLAWWFRAGNRRATRLPDWAYSGRVELLIWSVPFLAIVFLGGIAWVGAHDLDPAKPLASDKKPLDVQVVSLDWKWLFIYPDAHVAAVNQLVLPVGTPVRFALTSAGVWDSFFVPRLGSQIYTMKGMTTRLNLLADREGSFFGLSTHFSGDGFSDMTFPVRSVSEAAFADWIKATQAKGPALDEKTYGDLAKQSIAVPPTTFATVMPDLFAAIVGDRLPAAAGPAMPVPGSTPDITPKGGDPAATPTPASGAQR